jgi:hypothetical protein
VTVDPSVIAALEAAVDADPSNAPLTVHLAGLLLDASRPAEALVRCQAALAHAPADPALLEAAAPAARAAKEPPPQDEPGYLPTAHHADEGVVVSLRVVEGGRDARIRLRRRGRWPF